MKPGIGDPPGHLRGDALEKWNEIAAELVTVGTIARVDRTALETLCLAYQRLREAQQHVDDLGVIFEDPMKGWVKNPACTVVTAENQIIARLSAEFGITPASRGKVAAPQKDLGNPFDEF
jgi:P27 family predicted phage terminase small subunit